MSVLATDDFDRADNANLGASWDQITGEFAYKLASNKAEPSVLNQDCAEYHSGIVWPDDHYGQCILTPSTSGGSASSDRGIGLAARAATAARTYYRLSTDATGATNNIGLSKFVAAVKTNLWFRSLAIAAGDVVRLEVQGTTLRVFFNGVQLGADTTDASIATGSPGVSYSGTVGACSLDDWMGGDFVNFLPFKGRIQRGHW